MGAFFSYSSAGRYDLGLWNCIFVLENLDFLLLHFYRCEQEDTELKHNSTLKQLMREFNTQLAQKDRELELSIKETISKLKQFLYI